MKIYYMVMRLQKELSYMDNTVRLVDGDIPVFENYEKAIEYSEQGKYQIIGLTIKE